MDSELTTPQNENKIKKILNKIPRWAKILISIGVVLLLIIIPLINRSKNAALPVTTLKLTTQNIDRTVFTSGRLAPVNKQEFFTPEDSTLMELNVKVGDRVKKGDVLGRLDTLELARKYEDALARKAGKEAQLVKTAAQNDELNLKSAEAEYNKVKKQLERIQTLYETGAKTQEDLDNALADFARVDSQYQETLIKTNQGAVEKEKISLQKQVDLSTQEIAQAQERLELATFIAHEDGVVTFVGSEKGNRVLEGSHLLTVGNDKELEVTADINEIDAGSITLGQKVKITCMALPGQEFSGEITKVGAAAISQKSNAGDMVSVPVTISLEGQIDNLKIGYTVDLSITTMSAENVIALPMEAIINRDNKKLVYVIENGLAQEKEITTQIGNELYDIVLTGLDVENEIILNPSPDLKNGQKVQALPQAGEKI